MIRIADLNSDGSCSYAVLNTAKDSGVCCAPGGLLPALGSGVGAGTAELADAPPSVTIGLCRGWLGEAAGAEAPLDRGSFD